MPSDRRPELDSARLDRAFELVARHAASGRTTFASLAVVRSDGLVRSAAYLGDGPVDPAPRTAIASITKPITATATLQLVEDGALVLTEPISTYLPEFRPPPPAAAGGDGGVPDTEPEQITAWHVLTHTSGMSDATDEYLLTAPPTKEAMVERLSHERLRFRPGSAYAYTSDSFYLLAEIIERLSGDPYPEYLERRIFGPLGMRATTFDPSSPGPAGLRLEGEIGPPDVPHELVIGYFVSLAMPGGGLWSTAEDVAAFGRAMLSGGTIDGTRILGRPFVELMTRLHTAAVRELGTRREPGYGLGWGRPGLGRGSPASRSAFGHTGASGSELIVDPEHDLVVVYLRNDWGAPMTATEEAIQAVYAAIS